MLDISCFGDFDEFSLHRKQALQAEHRQKTDNFLSSFMKLPEIHPKSTSQQQPNHAKSPVFSNTVCLSLARLVDQSDCPQHTLDQQINMYTVFCSVLAWYLHHFQLVLTAFLVRILFCFRGFGDARPRIEITSQFSGALSVQVNSKAPWHSIKVHLGQSPHFVTRLEGNSLDKLHTSGEFFENLLPNGGLFQPFANL